MEERLQKILARAGVASRRAAERLIAEGRVTVNGTVVREMGQKADIERDTVKVDGTKVRAPERPVYLVLNKPKGVVTTRHDPQGRETVMTLVPAVAGLFPVGRLDVTTEGLLILTNDGAFAERISHPRYEVPRVYEAKVHGIPTEEALGRLRRGILDEGEQLRADRVRVIEAEKNAWLEVTVHEGKNREVRRMLEAVGHPVAKLRRVAIGPVTNRGLEPGMFRSLTPEEVTALQRHRPRPPGARPAAPRPRPTSPSRRPRPASPRPASPSKRPRPGSPPGGAAPARRRGARR